MLVKVSSVFAAPVDRVWALVKQSVTLRYVTRGLLGFSGFFPSEWEEGDSVTVRFFFFHFIPAWRHTLTVVKVDDTAKKIQTQEGGGLVKQWNHQITVAPMPDNQCLYTDEIDIKARPFTLFVGLYAHLFYRYRQLRWRKLLSEIGSERSRGQNT